MFKKLLIFFTFLVPIFSFAYEPFLTDDAGTTPKGKNQIDLYYVHIMEKSDPYGPIDVSNPGEEFISSASSAVLLPFAYYRGLTDNFELGAGTSYYGLPTGNYSPFANFALSAKYRFYGDAENGWAFALRPSFTFAHTISQQEDGLGMAIPGFGLAAIGSYYADNYEVYMNFSYLHQPYNSNYPVGQGVEELRTELYQLSVAPVWKLSDKVRIGLDLGMVTNVVTADQNSYDYFVMPVITYSPVEDIDFAISYLRVSRSLGDEFLQGPFTSTLKVGMSYHF
jgi:hypothetical protein